MDFNRWQLGLASITIEPGNQCPVWEGEKPCETSVKFPSHKSVSFY